MKEVEFLRVKDYSPRKIADAIENWARLFRGMRGVRVLLKPNLLRPATPQRAVTTHPAVIEGVLMVLRDWVKEVVIADSPGIGGFERVLRETGVGEVAERYGVECRELNDPVEVKGKFFKSLEVSRLALESAVVNLPKVKTHAMTLLTCCVKNLYGTVPGRRKLVYHFTAGRDREVFAKLLLDVYLAVSPVLNVVDGIVAMEGNGPSSGSPVRAEVLALGEDGILLDALISKDAFKILPGTVKVSEREGLLPDEYSLKAEHRFPRLALPTSYKTTFFNLDFALPFLDFLLPRVSVDREKCVLCGICVEKCPASAVRVERGRVLVNHRKCLRCYVCHEVCPQNAVRVGGGGWSVIEYLLR